MWDRTHRGLVAIVVAFCILGAIHSVVVPLFEAPDEVWHFSFVQVLATQRSLPVQRTVEKDIWLREAGQPPLYHLVAALAIAPLDISDFPGFVRFNIAHPAVTPSSQSKSPNVFIHTSHEAFPYRGAVLAVHILRLLTVLWGAGTVVGAYLVAREVVPTRPDLALATASVVAFNPHFVFISGVINNDAAAACLCTLTLWLSIRLGRCHVPAGTSKDGKLARASGIHWLETGQSVYFRGREQTTRRSVALGLLLGLALLSKLSALTLLPLVALALWLAERRLPQQTPFGTWWRDRDVRALLVEGSRVFGLAALVAGWWYVRNWLLYGDPLAWRVWVTNIGGHRIGLTELVPQFGHVVTSFWSPYDGLFPAPVLWALGLLLVLAAAGWVKRIVRRGANFEANADGLLLASTWFVLLLASLVRYMLVTRADEGRLLIPGIAAISLLLVLGLGTVVPQQWSGTTVGVVGVGLLLLSVASPFFAIAPRYAPPLMASTEDISGMIPFDDADFGAVHLLGAKVEPDEAQASETVRVTLYWEARATLDDPRPVNARAEPGTPPGDLRAVVRLWTIGRRLVGQQDTTPAGEVYPPDLWREGDLVRDIHWLQVKGNGPAMCRLEVDIMAGDETLGQVSSPAVLKLKAAPISAEEITHPLAYTLGGKIELIGYDVPNSPPSGEALMVTLYWRALAELDEDYTVFIHLLNGDGTLSGQGDGPPRDNDYPTSYWSPSEVVADTHAVRDSNGVPLEADLPADAYLLVGLYRLADLSRLPAYTTTGERVPHDAIRIGLLPK